MLRREKGVPLSLFISQGLTRGRQDGVTRGSEVWMEEVKGGKKGGEEGKNVSVSGFGERKWRREVLKVGVPTFQKAVAGGDDSCEL